MLGVSRAEAAHTDRHTGPGTILHVPNLHWDKYQICACTKTITEGTAGLRQHSLGLLVMLNWENAAKTRGGRGWEGPKLLTVLSVCPSIYQPSSCTLFAPTACPLWVCAEYYILNRSLSAVLDQEAVTRVSAQMINIQQQYAYTVLVTFDYTIRNSSQKQMRRPCVLQYQRTKSTEGQFCSIEITCICTV